MLEELSRYENLGTPGFFLELLGQLNSRGGSWAQDDIRKYFFNRIIDGETVFDGCLPMAIALGVVKIDAQSGASMEAGFDQFLASERYLRGKLIERLLSILKDDLTFLDIFSSKYLSYDVVYHLIQIENSAFKFKYAGFRKFLVSFGFLNPHPDSKIRKLIISPKHRRLFDASILPEVKRRKIGIENLEAALAQKQIAGVEAEEFVADFERARLAGHPDIEAVQRISDYDVGAGYDIVSFERIESDALDRFIEVKSCTVDRRFYWSRNEVEQARIKRDQYFLYLVDPAQIRKAGYVPMMIQNPYENIFMDPSWVREAQTWLFSKSA